MRCFRDYLSFLVLILVLPAHADNGPGLKFLENKNQWDRSIHFGVHVPGGNLFIDNEGFSLFLYDGQAMERYHDDQVPVDEATGRVPEDLKIRAQYVTLSFPGATLSGNAIPFGRHKAYHNFFVGTDRNKWASKVASYSGVVYQNVYEGIDMKVYSLGRNLKYDFIVAAEADPSCVAVEYCGIDALEEGADITMHTSVGDLIEKKPVAYQVIDGTKVYVPCRFRVHGQRLTFDFPGGYDPCYELVIDPLLIFSTYSGSMADNWGSTATPGEHGNLYSSGVTNQYAGNTYSGTFPATPGAFQADYGGLYDVGILKYDSTGQELLYASYLGGSNSESPHSLVMSDNEDLIVLGTTSSLDFATTGGAYDDSYNGGLITSHVVTYNHGSDIFIARISKDGTTLIGSTLVGGTSNDGLNPSGGPLTRNYGDQLRGDIITDEAGDIYVSTVTQSANFPVINSFDLSYNGGSTDAVVFKMKGDLTEMLWSTYIGGSGVDASHTIKLQDSVLFVGGGTTSSDFPVTSGSYSSTFSGVADGWMAKVAIDGSSILNATFTGTTAYDQVYFLDLDSDGDVYVYGQTAGNMEISPGKFGVPNSGQFVQKFSNDLSTKFFQTVFGSGIGIPNISPTAFLVNECDNLYMTGWGGEVNYRLGFWHSDTFGMPVSQDAFQKTTSGSDFYFIVLSGDATDFLYGTYMGGKSSKTHIDGGTCRFDKSGIVYHAVCSGCQAFNQNGPSSDFPTTEGVWSNTNNSLNCNNAAFKFDLSSLKARILTNSVDFANPGLKSVCYPDSILFQNLSTGGEIFEWNLGDGTDIVKNDTSAFAHGYVSEGTYHIKLKAIDANTCVGIDSTMITLSVYDLKPVVQDDDNVCYGDSYKLKASAKGTFQWLDTLGHSIGNTPEVTVAPEDTTKYYVVITAPTGCTREDSVTLNVIPAISPSFDFERTSECFGRPALHLTNTTLGEEGDTFRWDFGDGTSDEQDDVVHAYEKDDNYDVRLIGTRASCPYEATLDIPVFTVRVPNIITPGVSEGYNDAFMVQFGDTLGVSPTDYGFRVQVVIYSRWGDLVYKSQDYHNDWRADNAASGIYYYDVTIADHGTCKGWVHVMK